MLWSSTAHIVARRLLLRNYARFALHLRQPLPRVCVNPMKIIGFHEHALARHQAANLDYIERSEALQLFGFRHLRQVVELGEPTLRCIECIELESEHALAKIGHSPSELLFHTL